MQIYTFPIKYRVKKYIFQKEIIIYRCHLMSHNPNMTLIIEDDVYSLLTYFWAFRLCRRAFRYIFTRFLPHPSPILLLYISRCTTFTYFFNKTTLQQHFQCAFNGRFANIRTKCGNIRFLYNTEFLLEYSFHSIRF